MPKPIKPIHVDGCIPAPLRRTMDAIADNFENMADSALPGGEPVNMRIPPGDAATLGGQPPSYYNNINNWSNGTTSGINAFYVWGTLDGDLASGSGSTQTIGSGAFTVNGKFVRSSRKLASGNTVGALWNGTNYDVIVALNCDVSA